MIIEDFCDLSSKALDKTYGLSAHSLSISMQDDSPIDSTAFFRSWTASVGIDLVSNVSRSDALTGRIGLDTIKPITRKLKGGDSYSFLNGKDYALALEYGHSSQAPKGMLRVNVARWDSHVSEVARRERVA